MSAQETRAEDRAVLERLDLLTFLPGDVRALVVGSFIPVSFQFGEPIVREGEDADAFYVLVSGCARVVKRVGQGDEISLQVLRAGDTFGEMGLLERTTRTATVRASGEVAALRLDRSIFDALVLSRPEIRKYFDLQIRQRKLHNFFRNYTPFVELPEDGLAVLLAGLEPVSADKGQLVIREGDGPGPMYFVESGRLRVFVSDNGNRKYLAYLRQGDFFGEMSVFKGTDRTASVEAVAPCRLLALAEPALRDLAHRYPAFRAGLDDRIAQYDYKHVARVPLDFADELLPADATAPPVVAADQVEVDADAAGDGGSPFGSGDGGGRRRTRRIWRFPDVRQIDEMDCGAAALAMVCRHHGRAVNLARIRQLVHTGVDGASLSAICHAATELGLAARAVKAAPRHLARMPLPAVVHWEANHWVVVYDVGERHVRIADPALGHRRVTRGDFEKSWSGYAAFFDYTQAFEKAPVDASKFAWLMPFFKPHWPVFLQALGLAVIVGGLQLALPLFTQVIVDRVLVQQDVSLLNLMMIGLLAVALFMVGTMLVQRYLLSWAAVRIDAATLDFLTRRLLTLPMSYFSRRRTGDIQRRLDGMQQIRGFVVQNTLTAITSVAQLAATLTLMAIYSPLLTMVFLAMAPLYGGLMVMSSKLLRPIFVDLEESSGRYRSHQIDAIKGIETVKALGAEHTFREMMLNQFHGVARRVFKADFTMMSYDGATQMVTFLSMALFLWVGARQVMAGSLTMGGFVAFNALVALANSPVMSLLGTWDSLQNASVLLHRLNDVVDQEPEQGASRDHLVPVKSLEGRVTIRNLGFRYGGPESPAILQGISLDVPAGKMVAIIGRSGSGKTTLVKCLAGLLEPTEGTILYDGVELKTLNYRDLRRQIGFVLQENYLFDATIARNIGFAEHEADMDRVLWASRVANAHEFIERLPLGYDTKIGESGVALAGGQRQRVAIARAIYQRPSVLLMDEATSSLDTESERAVKENIDRLLQGRTSFVIAHRLSTIRNADIIIVIDQGRLVEQGSHDELIARRGLYFYLCSQQLGGGAE